MEKKNFEVAKLLLNHDMQLNDISRNNGKRRKLNLIKLSLNFIKPLLCKLAIYQEKTEKGKLNFFKNGEEFNHPPLGGLNTKLLNFWCAWTRPQDGMVGGKN